MNYVNKSVKNRYKRSKPSQRKPIASFCLMCKFKTINLFKKPCWECQKEYHSQTIPPVKPSGYLKQLGGTLTQGGKRY